MTMYSATELVRIGQQLGSLGKRINSGLFNKLKALRVLKPFRGSKGGSKLIRPIVTLSARGDSCSVHNSTSINVNNLVQLSNCVTDVKFKIAAQITQSC